MGSLHILVPGGADIFADGNSIGPEGGVVRSMPYTVHPALRRPPREGGLFPRSPAEASQTLSL
ncbi:MAG: hypothetical protein ACKO23_15930 [Gemmataceae bacterium]